MQDSTSHSSERKRPVVIIGLDGATFDLIEPWAAEGHLPNFQRLLQEGASGRLLSTKPDHSAPAWTSFSTGVNPGKHGVYFFVGPSFDKLRFRPVNARSIRSRRLWQIISDQGATVGAMNIPMSYPGVPVNGYMIGDFFAPDYRSAFDNDELYEEVLRECGGYCSEVWNARGHAGYLRDILACVDQQAIVGSYLLERHPVDFFAIVFTVLDRAQHSFWADMDPDHPMHGQGHEPMIPDALLQVHKALDQAVGRLLERVPSDANVIIMSDHGFRGEYRRLAVNKWLRDMGLLTLKTNRQAAGLMGRIRVAIKRGGLRKPAQQLLRTLTGTWRPESVYYRFVDWTQTKISYGPGQGFYVNLKDRDFQGIVTPAEYGPLCDQVISALKEVRDPDTGLPLVSDAFRRDDIYNGAGLELAPDIVPMRAEYLNGSRRWGYGLSKSLGAATTFVDQTAISGNHSPEGIFLAWGPDVVQRRLEGLTIMDIAPTTLYALGLQVPNSMDGRVITELFKSQFLEQNPVVKADIDLSQLGQSGQVMSNDQEAIVEQRLKDLGYL